MEKELKEVNSQVMFYETVSHAQVSSYLKQASIVLVPSLFESYSYVTIEAMCAGKAVVGSEGTGIANLIESNVTGKLANPYNLKEWKAAIKELMDDKALRQKLGSAAIDYVEGKKIKNNKIVGFYKSLLKEKLPTG